MLMRIQCVLTHQSMNEVGNSHLIGLVFIIIVVIVVVVVSVVTRIRAGIIDLFDFMPENSLRPDCDFVNGECKISP